MERAEKIESTRFLGSEFIVWIWFCSEALEARLEVPGFGPAEVWLDTLLVLEAPEEKGERVALRGLAPSGGEEARVALAQGKLPTQARLHLRLDPEDYGFVLRADTLARSQVQLPAKLKEAGEERFLERMQLLERLDGMFDALFREFLRVRVSPSWERQIVPALREWVGGGDLPSAAVVRGWLKKR